MSAIDTKLTIFYQNPPHHCHSGNASKFLQQVLLPEEKGTAGWKLFTRRQNSQEGRVPAQSYGITQCNLQLILCLLDLFYFYFPLQ